MPTTAFFQERVLTALEALQAAQEAVSGAASLTALQAIQASQATIAAASAASYAVTYVFPAKDWGATWTEVINTPAGKRGRVIAATVYDVTEIFSDTGSEARVDIGDGSDANAFAQTAGLGTTGVNASVAPAVTQGVTEIIPVNDTVTVTGVTAGTPGTGIATLALTVEFFT